MRKRTRTVALAGLLAAPLMAAVPASADRYDDAGLTLEPGGVSLATHHATATAGQADYRGFGGQLGPGGLELHHTHSQAGTERPGIEQAGQHPAGGLAPNTSPRFG